ncbi:lactate dehydrogenase/glycoside hydrolase [Phascolomyces articulosus]|uniref:L-lactate dehydrogenase n=1 Tax=Phascolomyces articulosus TaxID=60185 RepID=A0AAD5JRZ6_9FUNG|nr:lactate dehydrogenase/glycoside hydrolase [Phascolomyces articulosus]
MLALRSTLPRYVRACYSRPPLTGQVNKLGVKIPSTFNQSSSTAIKVAIQYPCRHYTTDKERCGTSKQVAVVGAGAVGSTIALLTMMKNVASEILLVDQNGEFALGQTWDLADANIVNSTKVRQGTYKEAGQSEVVVITAGAKQQPGESRQQLIDRNYHILKEIIGGMQPIRKDAVIMLVTNPVDTLTLIAQNLSGLPRSQVFGSGTFLDTSRLTVYLSDLFDISASCIHAYVLGEHGDSQFIAWNAASIGGRPLLSFPEVQKLDKEKVRLSIANKAMDIIQHKGSTYYGIGACASSICESVLRNSMDIRPLSVYVKEVGTVISLPAKVGANGIEATLPIPLGPEEHRQFMESVKKLREIGERYENLNGIEKS